MVVKKNIILYGICIFSLVLIIFLLYKDTTVYENFSTAVYYLPPLSPKPFLYKYPLPIPEAPINSSPGPPPAPPPAPPPPEPESAWTILFDDATDPTCNLGISWKRPIMNSYIFGCVNGCTDRYDILDEAKKMCEEDMSCSGITMNGENKWELRTGTEANKSTSNKLSYLHDRVLNSINCSFKYPGKPAILSTTITLPGTNINLPYNIPDIGVFDEDGNFNYAVIFTPNNDSSNGKLTGVKVFTGRNVCFFVDKNIANIGTDLNVTINNTVKRPILDITSTNKDINYYAMAMFVDIYDRLVSFYSYIFENKLPTQGPRYLNKIFTLETAYIEAGGLGNADLNHCCVGPGFFAPSFNSFVDYLKDNTNLPYLHQAIPYEAFRAFTYPRQFTNYFDYRCYNTSDRGKTNPPLSYGEWGWVNQGFVNVTGSLYLSTVRTPTLSFFYMEKGFSPFFNYFEEKLDTYIAGVKSGIYTWLNTMMFNRLIWTGQGDCQATGCSGLDDLYSGLLIRLFKTQGGLIFLKRLIKAVITLGTPRYATTFMDSPNAGDYVDYLTVEKVPSPHNNIWDPRGGEGPKLTCQTAAENYYIAASYGANKDLYDYFKNTLGAPIRDEARAYALKLMSDNP